MEYINIVKKYEDVISKKMNENKNQSKSKKKSKPQPYSLKRKKPTTSKKTNDPYSKYISFYPSRDTEDGIFEEKYTKRYF